MPFPRRMAYARLAMGSCNQVLQNPTICRPVAGVALGTKPSELLFQRSERLKLGAHASKMLIEQVIYV